MVINVKETGMQKFRDILSESVAVGKVEILNMYKEKETDMQLLVWKLGDLDNKILPTKESMDILQHKLDKLDIKGVKHLVWGPDIDVQVIECPSQ